MPAGNRVDTSGDANRTKKWDKQAFLKAKNDAAAKKVDTSKKEA